MNRLSWHVPFTLLALIWGCSFWWASLGLQTWTPIQVAFGRLALGAITLLVLTRVTGSRLPREGSTWRHLAVVALFLNSAPFLLFAFGQTRVTSILAAILNALTPVATLLVSLILLPQERATRTQVFGLCLGLVGVLVVLGVWDEAPGGHLAGVLACLAAVCCYGIALPYARRHLTATPDPPLALAAGQVLLGAAFLLPFMLPWSLAAHASPGPVTANSVIGMVCLGVMGSGLAYLCNFTVIRAAGAQTASTVTYLTPVVAVLVGAAFLREELTWNQVLGGVIVLAGTALSRVTRWR